MRGKFFPSPTNTAAVHSRFTRDPEARGHAARAQSWGVGTSALFVWLISHQPTVLFSQNKPAITTQPAVLFSQNKPVITSQQYFSLRTNQPQPSTCTLFVASPLACPTPASFSYSPSISHSQAQRRALLSSSSSSSSHNFLVPQAVTFSSLVGITGLMSEERVTTRVCARSALVG
jgi:hypothetical protein